MARTRTGPLAADLSCAISLQQLICVRSGGIVRIVWIIGGALFFGLMAAAPVRAQATQSCNGQSGIVPGPDTQVLCTRLVDFNGMCGKPNFPEAPQYDEDVAAYLNPWEDSSITVREVQVTAYLQGPVVNGQPQPANLNIGLFSGNSYNSDPMTPYEYAFAYGGRITVVRTKERFPDGTGMQFPGKREHPDRGPTEVHLDVHVDCGPVGATYFGRWFLAYTINEHAASKLKQSQAR